MTKAITNFNKDVKTFMKAAGQSTTTVNQPQSDLYYNLIKEEIAELHTSMDIGDKPEIIDACFDSIWVILGYMNSLGLDVDGIWKEGAANNLIKIDKNTGLVTKRDDGKILKPTSWSPPNFQQFVKEGWEFETKAPKEPSYPVEDESGITMASGPKTPVEKPAEQKPGQSGTLTGGIGDYF